MTEFVRDLLKLAEEVSGANVLTIVILMSFLGGYFVYKFTEKQTKFARKCGVQKQLFVGYVQNHDQLTPSEALIKANKMTKDGLDDV